MSGQTYRFRVTYNGDKYGIEGLFPRWFLLRWLGFQPRWLPLCRTHPFMVEFCSPWEGYPVQTYNTREEAERVIEKTIEEWQQSREPFLPSNPGHE